MKKPIVYAIVIAGGNGERLWPVSTPERPKQFVDIFDGKPLICHAVDSLKGIVPVERVLVITASKFISTTRKALPMLPRANIIGEPCRRDTASAIALAVGLVKRLGGENAIGCVLPADYLISPVTLFRCVLRDSIVVADRLNAIVTIGIDPTYPSTGFGYIKTGEVVEINTKTEFFHARRFVEKPNEKTAKKYLSDGNYRWNSGIFIWKSSIMENEFAMYAPDVCTVISKVERTKNINSTLRRIYPKLRSISVDYAVMEQSKNIIVAKGDFKWSDVGSWLSIKDIFPSDSANNICLGKTALLSTKESVVLSDDAHLLAVIGLSDVVVVRSQNATLVCAKANLNDIKEFLRRVINKTEIKVKGMVR